MRVDQGRCLRQPRSGHGTVRPNILILMVDQLNGTLFPDGPAAFLHAPHLKALAARSVRFANSYTASPLCAPARASFMSGQLPSRTRVYDNAAEFASDIPTFAHHLRAAGYQTTLSGKMHFVGPDQLHGFEERLTTDIYPADFGWTPDYTKPGERIDWWYHNLGSVTGAGVAEITNQMEYDDEVAYHATRKLYDLSRGHDERPWCLTVSFTHPHDPYVARRKYLGPLRGLPGAGSRNRADRLCAAGSAFAPAARCLRARCISDHGRKMCAVRAGAISPTSLMSTKRSARSSTCWNAARMAENTVVVFASDHGDMLGERGLWFKMSFFEGSARVPLMIAAPGWSPRLVEDPVSTLDVTPTLAGLAGIDMQQPVGVDRRRRPCAVWRLARADAVQCPWNMRRRVRKRRWSVCARGGSSCRYATRIRRCWSISQRIRTNWSISPAMPRMPAFWMN